jgi:hypothetical protein
MLRPSFSDNDLMLLFIESGGWLAKERPFKSLSRARFGNSVSCESGRLQHGHVCMCARRPWMHSKQNVWPHMLEKALTYVSLQIGQAWLSVRTEPILLRGKWWESF